MKLNQEKKLISYIKQDLQYTESEFKPTKNDQQSGGFQLAKQARDHRRKQRDNGGGNGDDKSNEPKPLSQTQQQFIQESLDRDQVIDNKLELIYQGVKQLGQIAGDINQELDKQSYMLDEVDQKMGMLTKKLNHVMNKCKKFLMLLVVHKDGVL